MTINIIPRPSSPAEKQEYPDASHAPRKFENSTLYSRVYTLQNFHYTDTQVVRLSGCQVSGRRVKHEQAVTPGQPFYLPFRGSERLEASKRTLSSDFRASNPADIILQMLFLLGRPLRGVRPPAVPRGHSGAAAACLRRVLRGAQHAPEPN